MTIVSPIDLIPEESPLDKWIRETIDRNIVEEIEEAIRGKRILTGDGVRHGN